MHRRRLPADEKLDDMSLARKIAWWSLLAMVFVVPVAMSNMTWLSGLGFPVSRCPSPTTSSTS